MAACWDFMSKNTEPAKVMCIRWMSLSWNHGINSYAGGGCGIHLVNALNSSSQALINLATQVPERGLTTVYAVSIDSNLWMVAHICGRVCKLQETSAGGVVIGIMNLFWTFPRRMRFVVAKVWTEEQCMSCESSVILRKKFAPCSREVPTHLFLHTQRK